MTQETRTERPPIVVVMGHVDHGKSTLLDFIRKSNVVAGEAGGITQHLGAYEVEHEREGVKKRITFIDTPGHAAFKSIRARGANVADIAILVVAADDGVKAQTLEALESIKASGTPFIVAINKIDKPNADIERTKYSLLEHGVYLEGLGGDISFAPISAKTGTGVTDLLDLILLLSDVEELTGNPSVPASGYVIEAGRDPRRGIFGTLVITDGSLVKGQCVAAGTAVAPLRLVEAHNGASLDAATFSTPVRVFGFDTMPEVGAPFSTHDAKSTAEEAAAAREGLERAYRSLETTREGMFALPVIVKADAAGSLEAILSEIAKLSTSDACFSIVGSGLGPVSEGDAKLAVATPESPATIVAFTVPTDRMASELLRQHNLSVESFDIIYKLTERLQELLKEKKPRKKNLEVTGRARILKHFSSKHDEHLVGGKVEEGTLSKAHKVRLVRKGEILATGDVLTIQHARQSVEKVEAGSEFGAQVVLEESPQGGDVLESYVETLS